MEELFDKAAEYDEMLNKGLKLTGEDKHFYIKGRTEIMKKNLPADFTPKRILDFGSGIGDATKYVADQYPDAEVVGIDTAQDAVDFANERFGTDKIKFVTVKDFDEKDTFDLCFVNGVFHHIIPEERDRATSIVYDALTKGGYFAYFENNPWNLGTRYIMSRVPFDRDAITLSHLESRRLLKKNKFSSLLPSKFFFYFPRSLKFLRPIEKLLFRWPFGGQYLVMAKK